LAFPFSGVQKIGIIFAKERKIKPVKQWKAQCRILVATGKIAFAKAFCNRFGIRNVMFFVFSRFKQSEMKLYTKLARGLLSVFVFIAVSQTSCAQQVAPPSGISFHQGTWAEAIALAKKEKKLIFVDAYAKWCGPCKWMSANIFTMPDVGDFFNKNFVNVKMDMEIGEGRDLARTWGITAYPTLMFFNSTGTETKRFIGAKRTGEEFINLGKSVIGT